MDSIAARSFALPGLKMQVLEAGPVEGPLVLLLHGFPELSDSWRGVLPLLAEAGFHAVAPDLRGYGGTERPAAGYDLDTLARDVVMLARELQPGRPVHLVGHDWGGIIAYHVAALFPEAVDRLAVLNAPHLPLMVRELWKPAQLMRSWYVFFFQLPWLPEHLLSAGGGALIPRLIRRSVVDPSRLPPGRLAAFEASFSTPESLRGPIDYYRQLIRRTFTPWGLWRARHTPRIQAPLLLIWGAQDAALREESFTRGLEPYFEVPPRVVRLADEGHFMPLVAPREVAALLLEHFAGERPARPTLGGVRATPRGGASSPAPHTSPGAGGP